MKQLFIKYLPIIIGITALADTQMQLLSDIGLSDTTIAWIKLTGLLLALYLPSVSKKVNIMAREAENSDPIRTDFPKGTKI